MKMISGILTSFLLVVLMKSVPAQPFATWNVESLTLDNGVSRRVIQFGNNRQGIVTNSLKLNSDDQEFINAGSEEFYFELDGKSMTGTDNWKLVSVSAVSDENKGNGAKVVLKHPDADLQVGVTYLMYPDLPIIRKKISFVNNGSREVKLESLDIERLRFRGSDIGNDCWVMHDYGRQKTLGPFTGNAFDPVVVVHKINQRGGIVLGNEAPGVMKRTTAFLEKNLLTTGLTHAGENFGFRQWIKPGETWESPWVFSGIYAHTNDPYLVLNGPVNDYVRQYMGTRLSKVEKKPIFVYNTWEPFWHNINEKLIYELADAAAECGFEEFIMDDGWQSSYGDWNIHPEKFPNGLKPVFDYIKSKGMKPGIWISLAAAESTSKVFKEHPEWLVRKADGSPINLQYDQDKMYNWESYSMCMTTGWYDHIKGIILNLIKEHGLEYVKADFAVATGAYTFDKTRSGCHAKDHPMHQDRNESLLKMYQRTWQLFDDLHREAPDLFIDCTYETMGGLQLIDLDMCKHADGNWLSNFSEKPPLGSLRVRQMSWWRSPTIPATAMVIGNQQVEYPDFELSLMSLAGSLPIVLGDPRQLSKDQRARMKQWADWLKQMQSKHDFMSFRQDLSGFGEPAEGSWDGFQRVNSDTHSGGVVGIFRQGAKENKRQVTIQWLDEDSGYRILKAPEGKEIGRMTGKELAEKGFEVNLTKEYDGALFEISRND
ncbi:MAG: glycoside hydrolase family 36 protein [Mangrovibacterium sp.]